MGENVLEAGTIWSNGDFRFFLTLATEIETKTVEAILHVNSTEEEFCEDCVWSVVVNWDAENDNGTAVENIDIHSQFRGKLRKTVKKPFQALITGI